jgi:hypothetical protein
LKERIREIHTKIEITSRKPEFKKCDVARTNSSLITSPTKNFMEVSAIFETKQENVLGKKN